MSVERQQGGAYQPDLPDEALLEALRRGATGEGGTGTGARAERQAVTAVAEQRSLTHGLIERVASSANLNRAYRRVKAKKGAPGVDGMTVHELGPWLAVNREVLVAQLVAGAYRPQPVLGVEIPKPGGGVRQLGIPPVGRPWSTAWCSKLSSASCSRSWSRSSRPRASAFARAAHCGEGRMMPSPKQESMSPRAVGS